MSTEVVSAYLLALSRQEVDEGLQHRLGHGQTLLFARFVEAQVHEERGRVLQPVRGRGLQSG
jgi:hypothetical protein